jgi:hypothetical protein
VELATPGGREAAAIVIVSTKPAAHFRTTPGGYSRRGGNAKTGQLNLARTICAEVVRVVRGSVYLEFTQNGLSKV